MQKIVFMMLVLFLLSARMYMHKSLLEAKTTLTLVLL